MQVLGQTYLYLSTNFVLNAFDRLWLDAHPVEHCVFGGLESAKLPLEPWMREAQAERTGENGKQWAAGKNWILTELVLDTCYFHPNFGKILVVEEHISEELFNHQLILSGGFTTCFQVFTAARSLGLSNFGEPFLFFRHGAVEKPPLLLGPKLGPFFPAKIFWVAQRLPVPMQL